MADIWTERELELTRKHEQLLLRREALLGGTEAYYDTQDRRAASFITDISKAQQRNQQLLQSVNRLCQRIHNQQQGVSPRLDTLRKNYWSMVRSLFPLWYKQYCQETGNTVDDDIDTQLPHHPSPPQARHPSPPQARYPSPPQAQHPSPRHKHSPHTTVYRSIDADDATDVEIPPLDLDFCVGEDSLNPTPHDAPNPHPSTSSAHRDQTRAPYDKKEKRVHYDEAQLLASKQGSKKQGAKLKHRVSQV